MIAMAIAFVTPALLRKQQVSENKTYRDGQNVTIAREHLADLDEELSNGTLTQELYDQSKLEIEQTLLFDLEDHDTAPQQATSNTSGKIAFATVLVIVPLLTFLLYFQLGTPDLVAPKPSTAQTTSGEPPSIKKMITDLQQRLKNNPEDADGWYLMGRTMMMMKQYGAAAEAYEKTNKLAPNEPMVMLALADSTAMAQGGNMAGRPKKLVFDAIAIDPNNTTGLWMAGMIAEEDGDKERALDLWLRLRPLIIDMPTEIAQLDVFIKRVATALGKDVSKLLTDSSTTTTKSTKAAASTATIQLTVKLADSFYEKVTGEEIVFIYAKAMQGPRFPIAAARYKVKDLPLTITLDDSNAVMSTSKLSDFSKVKVGARVSYSGDAITKSGDLLGEVANVTVGQGPITVTISEVKP